MIFVCVLHESNLLKIRGDKLLSLTSDGTGGHVTKNSSITSLNSISSCSPSQSTKPAIVSPTNRRNLSGFSEDATLDELMLELENLKKQINDRDHKVGNK